MRDGDEYLDDEAPPGEEPAAGPRGIVSMLLGAALAVTVVAGAAWWLAGAGEHTARELPVFRAELTPAKERPADPGGAETPYRDIRSYEVAAGGDSAEAPEVRLAPPPPSPTAEDLPMGELPRLAARDAEAPGELPVSAGAAVAELSDPVPEEGSEEGGDEPAAMPLVDPDRAAPAATPPVRPRPPDLVERSEAASQQAIDQAVRLAARAALSTIQIQLGAYTDRDHTESEWRRIADENGDLLDGRALAIQPTTSGGTKFYRLRVGPFDDRAEATRVCQALQARGQDCLVATNG